MKFFIILILQGIIIMAAKHHASNRQSLTPACQNSLQSKRIVIVGAGMAGLTSASELLKAGFKDVVVLEGSDRHGGRIFTQPQSAGGVLEFGAQWIHGEKNNPIFEIAKNKSLLYQWAAGEHDEYENRDSVFRTSGGRLIPERIVSRTFKMIDEIFDAAEDLVDQLGNKRLVQSIYKKSAAKMDIRKLIGQKNSEKHENSRQGPEASIGVFVRKEFTRRLNELRPSTEVRRWMESLFQWRMLYENTESASPSLDDISFSAWNDYHLPAGDPNVELGPKGYSGLFDVIMQNIPSSSIHLNTHVGKINWKNQDNTVKITASGGRTFIADHVIVTSSLGYLKSHHKNLFDPQLPLAKAESIDALGFGTMDKIFLFFEDNLDEVNLLWHPSDTFQPQYNDRPYTKSWYRGLFIFFPLLQHPNVMAGFISGDEAMTYEADVTDEETIDICHQLLVKFSADKDFPRPKHVLRTKWFSDKYANGSYSYRKVGSTMKDSENLAQPILTNKIPVLLFAGEATHPNMFSTTHGAYLSGKREAKRISKYYCR